MTVQTQPRGKPTRLLAGRPQRQHTFRVSPSTSTSRAERRHRCAQMAVLTLIPSCPFPGTTLTVAKCYFYARPASGGSWQAAALVLSAVGPSAKPSRRLELSLAPSAHRAPLTGPKGLQGLRTSHHPCTNPSSPLDRLQMVFHTLPSVSVS